MKNISDAAALFQTVMSFETRKKALTFKRWNQSSENIRLSEVCVTNKLNMAIRENMIYSP